jgi:FMN phosphatase YigB (HAD superfamily)
MDLRLVVLDFDGTFTDVDAEAEPFVGVFRSALLDLLGFPITTSLWDRTAALVRNDPVRFGWEFDGRIVAPADADPYILCTCVAQELFRGTGRLADVEVRSGVLQVLYGHAYKATRSVFRPDAREVIDTLLAGPRPVAVVTNSDERHVRTKLEKLLGERAARVEVVGGARKFVLAGTAEPSEAFDRAPDELRLPGFERPMLVKRGHYHDALRRVMRVHGVERFDEVLVVGDILELDLVLPAALGAAVHLVRDARPHEKAWLGGLSAGRGGHGVALRSMLERLVR